MSNQLAAIQKILASNLHSDKSLRHAIAGMNKNQAQDLKGEIYAELYWAKRNPGWFKDKSRKYFASIRRVYRWVANRLNKGSLPPERNKNGWILERRHWCGSIAQFEAKMHRSQLWANYHTGDYTSLWASESQLKLINYCEGDVVILTATSREQWDDELADNLAWYAEEAA